MKKFKFFLVIFLLLIVIQYNNIKDNNIYQIQNGQAVLEDCRKKTVYFVKGTKSKEEISRYWTRSINIVENNLLALILEFVMFFYIDITKAHE